MIENFKSMENFVSTVDIGMPQLMIGINLKKVSKEYYYKLKTEIDKFLNRDMMLSHNRGNDSDQAGTATQLTHIIDLLEEARIIIAAEEKDSNDFLVEIVDYLRTCLLSNTVK